VLIAGLALAGGGSVIAASGGSSSHQSAAKTEYCPPGSPGAGQPKPPGGNCGNPPETCPNGQPKPPGGNCGNPPATCPNGQPKPPPGNCGVGVGVGLPGGGGNGNGNPQGPPEGTKPPPGKKAKRARFHVKRRPAKRCYGKRFTLRVGVVNRGKGGRTDVYRDGRRVKRTGRNRFTVSIDVRKLKPGAHTVKLRTKGADGKWRTRTVRFRRC
jgi:hypothetical protein